MCAENRLGDPRLRTTYPDERRRALTNRLLRYNDGLADLLPQVFELAVKIELAQVELAEERRRDREYRDADHLREELGLYVEVVDTINALYHDYKVTRRHYACLNDEQLRDIAAIILRQLVLSGDPPGSIGPRCMVGTLRPEHRERANSAAAFAAAKLLVEVGKADQPWRPGAYRHEVILPHGADDRFSCPRTLFSDIDAVHVPGGKALLTYITLTWTPTRLHHGWRIAHRLAADLVETFSIPALIIQHVPGLVANTAIPHCHLLVGSRSLSGIGWGGYVAALNGDRAWSLIRAKFDALLMTMTMAMAAGTIVTARPDGTVGASRPEDTEGVAFDASR